MFSIDLAAYMPLILPLVLLAFLGVFVYMRDPLNVGPHQVTRSVWCPEHKRTTMVAFTERVQTGMALRRVHCCSLRRPGEPCGEECAHGVNLRPRKDYT